MLQTEEYSLKVDVCVIVAVLELAEDVEETDEVALAEPVLLDEEDWDEMLVLLVGKVLEVTLLGEVNDDVVAADEDSGVLLSETPLLVTVLVEPVCVTVTVRVEVDSDSVADLDKEVAEEVEAAADDSVPVLVVLLLIPVGRVAEVEVPELDTLVEDELPVMVTVEVWVMPV